VASVTSALPTPWRYQGRILESAPGTPDLYDFGARSYNPTLGAFTSLDSMHGSAGNPALLNGYLYANANPATLVDPDGHWAPTLLTQIRGALILH
jgi:RHS repeat-associated protein